MDELVHYLHATAPENVIIGEDDCNLLILGDKSTTPTTIKMLLLVVGSENDITDATIEELRRQYRDSPIFRQLFDHGKRLAKLASIPFVMTAYRKCLPGSMDNLDIDAMTFLVDQICPSEGFPAEKILTSDGFVRYLYDLMGVNYTDSGTTKPKNRHLADAFHIWSRTKLSSRLAKQDFDAIYFRDGHYAMIEIKRSPTQSIERWSPYVNDNRNYDIQYQFARLTHAPFYTFHHRGGPCVDDTVVGSYEIRNVDLKQEDRWIDFLKTRIRADRIIKILDTAAPRG